MNNLELAVLFFLQLAVILLACRVVGMLAARIGQPQVVAEMITGVLLGPSLFGAIAPQWQQAIFPWDATQTLRDTQAYLFPISQLGLALYMFVVGMEFRSDIIRTHWRSSLAVSLAGMLAPFALGAALAWVLHERTQLFPAHTPLVEAVLFLGASLCITAFPMLARIIHYKGLAGTKMGTVALGAGAIDDAAAWCLLAVVLASIDGNPEHAALSIGSGLGYVLAVLIVVRPILAVIEPKLTRGKTLSETGFVLCLALMALGAWFTDRIGLHAVFGAFVMGVAVPRPVMARDLVSRMEPLAVALFLPLFFTYSGLNTKITLLLLPAMLLLAAVVLAAGVIGKGVACAVAAWTTGLSSREAAGVGTLMNARGLMELIIINIGLARGIISDELFATLVVMAIATTLVASPLFDRFAAADSQPAWFARRIAPVANHPAPWGGKRDPASVIAPALAPLGPAEESPHSSPPDI
jgi:Kef-type K+ transport system membrane component KefB